MVNIADGDTLTILDGEKQQHKIRFWGIDAPERGQPYANASKQRLSALIGKNPVIVVRETTDRYGREVGRVYALVDVGELLVREGLAYHYLQYAPNDTALAGAETFARQHRLGVWALPDGGQRPWDYRRGGKTTGTDVPAAPSRAQPERVPPSVPAAKAEKRVYWVTKSSGKVHNSSCRYYARSKGYSTETPTGPNCMICGGARE